MPNVAEDVPRTNPGIATTPEAPPEAPRRRSRLGMVLIAVVVLVAVGVGVYLHFQNRVSSDDANVDGHVTWIAPRVGGNVIEVAVSDNQHVNAGDLLVRIDPRDYQARLDQAKAALLQAQSQLSSAQTTVPLTNETTQSGASAAEAQLADAQAEYDRARIARDLAASSELAYAEANVRAKQAANDRAQADLARMRPLAEKAEISRQQFDAYTAAARVAESELQASREKLASARKDVSSRDAAIQAAQSRINHAKAQLGASIANRKQVAIRSADVGTAKATVEAARANLEAAELQLSYTTIVAPISGVVTRKSVELGQIVAPGQSLMTLIPLHNVWVVANFKETQLANVHPGQRAEIHVDMYGKTIPGRVNSIAGATGSRLSLLPPENATGNFVKVVQRIPVKITVAPQNSMVLRPGMNVDVTIFTK
jgi:membrane fusion protein (multidrug efflux system)